MYESCDVSTRNAVRRIHVAHLAHRSQGHKERDREADDGTRGARRGRTRPGGQRRYDMTVWAAHARPWHGASR